MQVGSVWVESAVKSNNVLSVICCYCMVIGLSATEEARGIKLKCREKPLELAFPDVMYVYSLSSTS